MNKAALVLEGGGIRGIYTAGVLDTLLKHDHHFDYTIGVSAGAAYGASYISRQIERNLEINVTYTNDSRYMGFRNLLRKGNFFNFEFIFGEIPERLIPFDFDAYFNSEAKFVIGITNCETGKCEYFEGTRLDAVQLKEALTATSSMPFVSKMQSFQNKLYLDGGISDSIPYEKAFEDGSERIVVVLTRNHGYQKKDFKVPSLVRSKYRKHPKLAEAIIKRPADYNRRLMELERLEKDGKAFILRPQAPIIVGRMEKDIKKIKAMYYQACEETEFRMAELRNFLSP